MSWRTNQHYNSGMSKVLNEVVFCTVCLHSFQSRGHLGRICTSRWTARRAKGCQGGGVRLSKDVPVRLCIWAGKAPGCWKFTRLWMTSPRKMEKRKGTKKLSTRKVTELLSSLLCKALSCMGWIFRHDLETQICFCAVAPKNPLWQLNSFVLWKNWALSLNHHWTQHLCSEFFSCLHLHKQSRARSWDNGLCLWIAFVQFPAHNSGHFVKSCEWSLWQTDNGMMLLWKDFQLTFIAGSEQLVQNEQEVLCKS